MGATMPFFAARSKANLLTCHPDLQRLFDEVILEIDCAIIWGHRGKRDQNEAFMTGKSQKAWPESRHNSLPSEALDAIPVPVDWTDIAAFHALAAVVKEKAAKLGISVTWGGDWPRFKDYPHWELKR
jgi:peptidoglycan L-alanyl-D-glutamate endopeptidase CwlK